MSAIKKALRSSMRRKRYAVFEQKENDYIHTPTFKRSLSNPEETVSSDPSQQFEQDKQRSAVFRRGSQVTRSFRDAVGVIRQVCLVIFVVCLDQSRHLFFTTLMFHGILI